MQDDKNPNVQLSEEQYKVIWYALSAYNRVSKLVHSELVSSCLVKNHIKNNPNLTPSDALKKVLIECVDELGSSNSEYKDIIVGRYFDDLTVAEMRDKNRPRPFLAERTFKKLQKEALIELGYIFFEKEAKCRLEDTTKTKAVPWVVKYLRVPLMLVLLVGLLLLLNLLRFPFIFAAQNTPSGTSSSIADTSDQAQDSPTSLHLASSICGEDSVISDAPNGERFMPSQGVSTFTIENTPGGVQANQIREVKGTREGVFISYYDVNTGGLSFFNRSGSGPNWIHCNNLGILHPLINSILVEDNNQFWIATDGDGVFFYDGQTWSSYNISNSNLPSNAVFEITKDIDGEIWAGTADGIARYEDGSWRKVYKNELFHNQVSSLAFESIGNVWVGHIEQGISFFDNKGGSWKRINKEKDEIGSNKVRGILIRRNDTGNEEIWIASDGGGVDVYQNRTWKHFGIADGLPSLSVEEIKLDPLNRVWVATNNGVAYYNEKRWVVYTTLPSHSVDFSSGCSENNCPEDSQVWTGTESYGLTHSRLPYSKDVLVVNRICFIVREKDVVCPPFDKTFDPDIVSTTLPFPINPGDTFYFEIHVTPVNGYKLVLNDKRGDFLSFTGEDETNLFGAYKHVVVEGEVQTGQTFIFSNRQAMFTAPNLQAGQEDGEFSTSWRVWMYTRYAGPEIQINFTVRLPST